MHARELIDLAALVAAHTPALLRAQGEIPEKSVEAYWVTSKCRLDRWGRSLKKLATSADPGRPEANGSEHRVFRSVLEEILASEVLTRVWSAALCAYDRAHGTDRMEPVARSVLIGQIEARHRVLTILAGRSGLSADEGLRLDALRRRAERWSDVLVGYLAADHEVREFAVDPDRAADFAEDFAHQRRQQGGRFVWPVVVASLQAVSRQWLEPSAANPDLNAKIAASILDCFPPEIFDDLGTIQSEWLLRVAHITNEAEGMLEALLGKGDLAAGNRPRTIGGRFDRS